MKDHPLQQTRGLLNDAMGLFIACHDIGLTSRQKGSKRRDHRVFDASRLGPRAIAP